MSEPNSIHDATCSNLPKPAYCTESCDDRNSLLLGKSSNSFKQAMLDPEQASVRKHHSNGYRQARSYRQYRSFPPKRVIATLKVDTCIWVLYCFLIILNIMALHQLLPAIPFPCAKVRDYLSCASQIICYCNLFMFTLYVIVWNWASHTRLFRIQWIFVALTISQLLLAFVNMLWSLWVFFTPDCYQLATYQSKPRTQWILNGQLIEQTTLSPENEYGIVTTTIPPILDPSLLSNKFSWHYLIYRYDLRLMAITHLISMLLITFTSLHLMGKRSKFAIDCLRRRGLLVEYYWATLD